MVPHRWFAIVVLFVAIALPASAQPADVIHFWTSGGESRAVAVFAHEYETRGGKWIDDPAIGPQAEIALAMNRIAGGNPPTAMQWQTGAPARELAQQGLLADLDWLAAAGNWKQTLPPLLLHKGTVDGHAGRYRHVRMPTSGRWIAARDRGELTGRFGGLHVRMAPEIPQHVIHLPENVRRERQDEMRQLVATIPR